MSPLTTLSVTGPSPNIQPAHTFIQKTSAILVEMALTAIPCFSTLVFTSQSTDGLALDDPVASIHLHQFTGQPSSSVCLTVKMPT